MKISRADHIRLAVYVARRQLLEREAAESAAFFERQELLATAEWATLDAELRATYGLAPDQNINAETGEVQ